MLCAGGVWGPSSSIFNTSWIPKLALEKSNYYLKYPTFGCDAQEIPLVYRGAPQLFQGIRNLDCLTENGEGRNVIGQRGALSSSPTERVFAATNGRGILDIGSCQEDRHDPRVQRPARRPGEKPPFKVEVRGVAYALRVAATQWNEARLPLHFTHSLTRQRPSCQPTPTPHACSVPK